jgi:hypothetical protein
MDTTYEIFKKVRSAPLWVESVTGLQQTKQRLTSLNQSSPGDYFAYDVHEARIVAELSAQEGQIENSYKAVVRKRYARAEAKR